MCGSPVSGTASLIVTGEVGETNEKTSASDCSFKSLVDSGAGMRLSLSAGTDSGW